jgi:hypothetical protein
MPGAGSSLDRNDYQLLERLTRAIERQAEATEELTEELRDG